MYSGCALLLDLGDNIFQSGAGFKPYVPLQPVVEHGGDEGRLLVSPVLPLHDGGHDDRVMKLLRRERFPPRLDPPTVSKKVFAISSAIAGPLKGAGTKYVSGNR